VGIASLAKAVRFTTSKIFCINGVTVFDGIIKGSAACKCRHARSAGRLAEIRRRARGACFMLGHDKTVKKPRKLPCPLLSGETTSLQDDIAAGIWHWTGSAIIAAPLI
jgi:hypothetical protein